MPRVRRSKINPGMALRIVASISTFRRFFAKVLEVPGRLRTPCWVWQGHCDDNGYGQFRVGRKVLWAHRASYAMFRGPIRDGKEVDHRCRNTSCVNPWHIRSRAPLANATDGGRCRTKPKDDIPF